MKLIKMITFDSGNVDVFVYEYNFRNAVVIYSVNGSPKVIFFESYCHNTDEQYYIRSNFIGNMSDDFQKKAIKKLKKNGIELSDCESENDYFSVPISQGEKQEFDIEIS